MFGVLKLLPTPINVYLMDASCIETIIEKSMVTGCFYCPGTDHYRLVKNAGVIPTDK